MDVFEDDGLLKEFFLDALEHMEGSDKLLMGLESGGDQAENIALLFRAFHSVKGGAAMFDLKDLTRLAHTIENRLDEYRQSHDPVSADDLDNFLLGADLLKHILETRCQELEDSSEKKNFDAEIDEILEAFNGSQPAPEMNLENLKAFQLEALENLEVVEAGLMDLENSPEDKELINEIFRGIHTIKGSSDYVGVKDITDLGHKLESFLDIARKDESFIMGEGQISSCLFATDVLRNLVENCLEVNYKDKNLGRAIHTIDNEIISYQSSDTNLDPMELEVFSDFLVQNFNVLGKFCDLLDDQERRPKAANSILRAVKHLKNYAKRKGEKVIGGLSEEVYQTIKSSDLNGEDLEVLKEKLATLIDCLETKINSVQEKLIEMATQSVDIEETMVDVLSTVADDLQVTKSIGGEDDKKERVSSTLRIEQELADNFTNLVGELTVAKNSLFHLVEGLKSSSERDRAMALSTYSKLSNDIAQLSNELNYNVMKMRMVPVKQLFSRFPRLVRDLSKKVDKPVKIQLFGEETEIDKTIAEKLVDPLVHMIRNSLDHGIEKTENRIIADKPEEATVSLSAKHEGSKIVIELKDDGGGIDTERVLDKALKNNLVKPDQIEKLTHDEIISFIMLPGFSTAAEVTDLSGRGVGMDVVKSNIEKLKGKINVSSERGVGTTFRMELPLTMAIVEALMVEDAKRVYAIPLDNVTETLKVKKSDIFTLMGRRCVSLRGDVVGIDSLKNILFPEQIDSEPETDSDDRLINIVILNVDGKSMGIILDKILKNEDIVVKALPDVYKNNKLLAGASILGDGRAILIVDTNNIISMVSEGSMLSHASVS
ncbi:MAG: chemotaxis protein CheA [Bdellovibrionota bacterium]|nr:chemotaxis protein CheA [Bdellovibrionota bacterium]